MTDFEFAYRFTLKWERGIIDHPSDPGGLTNDGISINFLKNYSNNAENRHWLISIGVEVPITRKSVLNLTVEQKKAIYRRAFWDVMIPETWPSITIIPLYDMSVNSGYGRAIRCLQQACNEFDGEKLIVDGLVGKLIRARVWDLGVTKRLDLELALKSIDYRENFLRSLQTFNIFGRGWMNRINDLRMLLNYLC